MSRWSEEEDKYILVLAKNLEDEPEYCTLSTQHNEKFNVKRTELAYKARFTKTCKENNITLNQKSHWTDDEKQYIIKKVNESPLDINWEEIATHLNRSEDRVKRTYLELVSPKEQIEQNILSVDSCMLQVLMDKMKNECSMCNCKRFTNLHKWQDKEYCEECYDSLFSEEIKTRWDMAHKYSIDTNKSFCNLCNKKAIIDNNVVSRFHYDHIDMFDKSFSICEMIKNGSPMSDIYSEIDKCQLLCVSCHKLVTKIENQCGFVRYKKQLTKEYNETNDEIARQEKQKEYSQVYNKFMSKVYNIIRESI
jgi:hypothetical protein